MNTFAARSLPPGDRDDAPLLVAGETSLEAPDALSPSLFEDKPSLLSPAVVLTLTRLRGALDEANMALGDLHFATAQSNLALALAAASKLEIALRGDPTALSRHLLASLQTMANEQKRKRRITQKE